MLCGSPAAGPSPCRTLQFGHSVAAPLAGRDGMPRGRSRAVPAEGMPWGVSLPPVPVAAASSGQPEGRRVWKATDLAAGWLP